jgi:hypothetical protein
MKYLQNTFKFLKFFHLLLLSEKRNVYELLMGKPKGKRPFGRPRVVNIKTDLFREWLGLCGLDWSSSG